MTLAPMKKLENSGFHEEAPPVAVAEKPRLMSLSTDFSLSTMMMVRSRAMDSRVSGSL